MSSKKSKKQKVITLLAVNFLAILALIFTLSVYGRILLKEANYAVKSFVDDDIRNSQEIAKSLPKDVKEGKKVNIKPVLKIPEPVDSNFSVVIPKIDVNNKVIPNIDINNSAEVDKALGEGVGWAKGSVEPGDLGNSLIFSHSTQNAWDIFRYNSVFTLLSKMEKNDMFSVVYKERQMDFIVYEKLVVHANDLSYLKGSSSERLVTLQTCHPAGSDKYRLLVKGRLVAMETT